MCCNCSTARRIGEPLVFGPGEVTMLLYRTSEQNVQLTACPLAVEVEKKSPVCSVCAGVWLDLVRGGLVRSHTQRCLIVSKPATR